MKTVILAVVLTAVGSVPAPSLQPAGFEQEYYRDQRSNMANEGQVMSDYYRQSYPYQQYQYVSPCAAAAAAAASASAPIAAIASPQHYGYQYPHYRTEEQELMSYSDEHFPMARYSYAPNSYVNPATTAPVFGVFPTGNTGGCNVPLLFSCTPNVVRGHVVPAQPHYPAPAPATPDVYRGVEPHQVHDTHESHESHEAPALHDHATVPQQGHAHQ